jgi:hypothetical protein
MIAGGQRRKKDGVDKLFDSIKVKDMTRAEFRRRYIAATNPATMRHDLARIQDTIRARQFAERENRAVIERGLS